MLKHVIPLLALALGFPAADAADRLTGPVPRGEALTKTAAAMLADAPQSGWIRDGKSTHIIYVFFDPNCPYCHKVYAGLRPQVAHSEVELRWIPIGVLMTTSLGKAATMLESSDPTEALHRNERGFSKETGSFGGIEEEPVPRDDTLKRLDFNLALLRRSGTDAVPSLLYRAQNGVAHFIVGAPPQNVLDKLVRDLE